MTLTSPATPATNVYPDLKRLIISRDLLEPQPLFYWMKTALALGTLGIAVTVAVLIANPWVLLADAALLGFASTQIALLAHDVGHRQGYRGRRANLLARLTFGNLLLGISHTWWTVKHNQHHATPNHIDEDPDIQFPMIVFSVDQIASRPRLLRPLMALQAFVFPLLLPFQALNMRFNSLVHVVTGRARRPSVEGLLFAAHYGGYVVLLFQMPSWGLAAAFAVVHHMVFGFYNSSVFASNHKGMPLIDARGRLDFFREQVLTSRNVTGHWWSDFWFGGLNYQIEHHLFPTMPRNNLRRAQLLVREFCAEQAVPYHATSALRAYGEIFAHLHRVTASLRNGASPAL